ncbi:MAG: hypothetical protein ACSLFQ_02755 [Thermoanaerobaculia bacterium]
MARSLVLLLSLVLAALPLQGEDERQPRTTAETTASPEGAATGLTMRGVSLDAISSTISVTIDHIVNSRGPLQPPSNVLRLEVWTSVEAPVFGESLTVRVTASQNLPFTLSSGETRANVITGPIPYNPPAGGTHFVTVALLEYNPATIRFEYADLYTLPAPRRFGPAVLLKDLPQGLIQRIGSGGATDSFVVMNVGNAAGNVTFERVGDFFTINPSSVALQPNDKSRVTIVASARTAGFYRGEVIVAVNGQTIYRIPIRLLAANPPAGTVRATAAARRVDVNGGSGAMPRGQVRFTNTGNSALAGFPVSDSPWLILETDALLIPPGESATVNFLCDRSLRTDTQSPTVAGSLGLKYVLGEASSSKGTFETPPTSLAGVVVTDTNQPTSTTGAIPQLGTGEVAVMIPGVGHVVGSVGEFVSDLSIVNGLVGSTVGDMKLFYSSSTVSKAAPNTLLAPTQAMNLADVVTGFFGETGQVGTIQIRSKSLGSLSMAANVFNKSNAAGTYGTAIPAFRTDRAITQGQKLVISGLRQDATSHTNIYLQEMSGVGQAMASIAFFDMNGANVGNMEAPPVPAFGLGSLFAVVPQGAVSAVVTSMTGKLSAYATPVDDASGDTWAVADWSRQYQLTGTERTIIPVAGALAGANNSNFRTDVSITNTGAAQGSLKLTYFPSAGSPVSGTISLTPNQSRSLEDVVPSFFNVSGASVGWISVEPQSGSFAVTSRTYTKTAGDPATFGTGVATMPPSAGLKAGQSRVFGGLEDSTTATVVSKQGATFRTNVGLIEVSGQPATARVSVYFADGAQLAGGGANASKDFALAANQFMQLTGVVKAVIGDSRDTEHPDLRGVSVRVEIVSGEGSVIPYVTSTDNGTNDTVLRTE